MLTAMEGEIDSNAIIVGDFNILFTPMDRSSRQKVKKTQALNNPLDQIDLIDICGTFHPKASAYRIFSRIEHIMGHKSSLRKLNKI